MTEEKTAGEILSKMREQLSAAGIENAPFEARVLLSAVVGVPRIENDRLLSPAQETDALARTKQRCSGYPLQYLCGTWEFYGMEFSVGEGVLIPRQDTETLVDVVLEERRGFPRTHLLDLCSGTGCVAAAISAHLSHVTGGCVEVSAEAFSYLKENLTRHAPQLALFPSDVFHPDAALLAKKYDVITCNPPYLSAEDMTTLQREVSFEPNMALFGGEDGLDFYRALIPLWAKQLALGGMIAFEVGAGQAFAVREIFRTAGLTQLKITRDAVGIERVVSGKKG